MPQTLRAQEPLLSPPSWEEFVSNYLTTEPLADNDTDLQTQLEWLEELARHPIDLHTATRADLLVLPFLSPAQADSLLAYRDRNRGFIAQGEWQLVKGLDYTTRRYLSLFVHCDTPWQQPDSLRQSQAYRQPSLKTLLSRGRMEAATTADIPLYRRDGYRTPAKPTASNYFCGNGIAHVVRFSYKMGQQAAYGLIMQKDAGEPVAKAKFYPYDYLSAHFMLAPTQRPWAFIVGDYDLRHGRGLVVGRPVMVNHFAADNPRKQEGEMFRPHTSTNEDRFFRGAAYRHRFGPLSLTAFVSYRRKDARLVGDTAVTLYTTGLHRTLDEIAHARRLGLFTTGGAVIYRQPAYSLSVATAFSRYDKPVWPPLTRYNHGYFRGRTALTTSVGYRAAWGAWGLQGEAAIDQHGHPATDHKLSFRPHRRLMAYTQLRYFAPTFVSLYGGATMQGGRQQNETGITLGAAYQPSRFWTVEGWADVFEFIHPTYTTRKPHAKGVETHLQVSLRPNRTWQWSLRHKMKTRQYSLSAYNLMEYRTTHRLTLSNVWTGRRLHLQSALSGTYAHRQAGQAACGWMVSVRPSWQAAKQLILKAFAAYFSANENDATLYAYEPQLYQMGGFPSFRYRGCRLVALTEWQPRRHLHLGLRLSSTHYLNRDTQSSGPLLIRSPWKNDLQIQLRWTLPARRHPAL